VGRLRVSRWLLIGIAGVVSILAAFVAGEIMVRFAAPQAYMVPRWKYSADYGHMLYPGTTMLHAMPGIFAYRYGINELGYRGPRVPISNHYVRSSVVVLGDSYAFGTGVQDGEEFSAVMGRALGPRFQTINLAVGGWGLAQEIRRFYEFGLLYEPRVVILQFCANDLSDGVRHRVARVEDGRFVFQPTATESGWLRASLASSAIQRSQLYNFFRQYLYNRVDGGPDQETTIVNEARSGSLGRSTVPEQIYLELLSAFAEDLADRGVPLFMVSVNGQLEQFPALTAGVARLSDGKPLTYIDVRPWFDGLEGFDSPEGHAWGVKAHAILGARLAEIVTQR